MTQSASRGILMFAQNNQNIDYLKIATTNALLIRKHLGVPVTVVTNQNTLDWGWAAKSKELIESTFDKILIQELDPNFENPRAYRDTIYHAVNDNFNNKDRASAYALSPYDETILIDADYLVFNSVLNHCWGSVEDVMINKDAVDLNGLPLDGQEHRLNDFGIRMYWATCIYFKKSETAKLLFDMVEHVREHWDYYRLVYDFPGGIFRNDFAFSIAIHSLNGFVDSNEFKALPEKRIITVLDSDQVYAYNGDDEMTFFVNSKKENWKFELSRTKNLSVHLLNKLSLLRQLDKIIEELK